MLYVNYEEAVKLLDSRDLVTVRIVGRLQQVMLSGLKEKPQEPFDMLYFFCSITRVVAEKIGHELIGELPTHGPVHGVHTPDLSEDRWSQFAFVTDGLASDYVNAVLCEFANNSEPFDLSFACSVAGQAFDTESIAWLREAVGKTREVRDDFDSWLGGFNSPTTTRSAKREM